MTNLYKHNIGIIYDTLCNHLSKSIIEKNNEKCLKIKNIIKEFFIDNMFGNSEIKTYKTIEKNTVKDIQLKKTLVIESLKNNINSNKEKFYSNLWKSINENFSNDSFYLTEGVSIKKDKEEFYNLIQETLDIYRNKNNTLNIKKILLENIDKLIQYENHINKSLQGKIQAEIKNLEEINPLIVRSGIQLFNEKYSDELEENEKEIIQDYIYYNDNKKLVQSVANRISAIMEQIENNKEKYLTVENINEFYIKMKEYKNYISNNENEIQLEGLIQTLIDFQSINEELKKISTKENNTENIKTI